MEGTKAENGLPMGGATAGSRENNVFPLRIGQKIKHIRIVINKEQKTKKTRTKKGTVTDLYQHIFRVKWDDYNWMECFPYGMLESTEGERIQPL